MEIPRLHFKLKVLYHGLFILIALGICPEVSALPYVDGGTADEVFLREVKIDVTPEQQQKIIEHTNKLRRAQGAADMEYMTWNNGLAEMAQLWSDTCEFEHGQPDYPNKPYSDPGQNLWATSGTSANVESILDSWYSEIANIVDNTTFACKEGAMCGHYTQLVWSSSKEMGFGIGTCPDNKWKRIATANFGPAGNLPGEKPFKRGAPCTRCGSGDMTCYEDLCRTKPDCEAAGVSCTCNAAKACGPGGTPTSQCTCECKPGFSGVACDVHCQDHNSNCATQWYAGCYMDYIKTHCPLTCKTCTEN